MDNYSLVYDFFENRIFFDAYDLLKVIILSIALHRIIYNKRFKSTGLIIFMSLGFAYHLFWEVHDFAQFNSSYIDFKNRFENGNYETITGTTNNYIGAKKVEGSIESFYVDSVFFSYSKSRSIHGYHNPCAFAGLICESGIKVKIDYVEIPNPLYPDEESGNNSNSKKFVNRIIKLSLEK